MAVTDFPDQIRTDAEVAAESSPGTAAELVELLRSKRPETPVFVGAGRAGGPLPRGPLHLVHLRHLEGETVVSTDSLTLDVPASTTWDEASATARSNGLSLDHLVDTWGDETVGGTLASTEVLPPLWMSSTARSACVALSALSLTGVSYEHINAPRTASGPDLRALFLGCHGQHGPIVRAVIEARRAVPTKTYVGCFDRGLQPLVNEFGSVLSVRGDERGIAALVRVDSRLGRLAAEHISELGLEESEPSRIDRPEAVLTVPWARVRDTKSICPAAAVLAVGPTHVAMGTSFAELDAHRAGFVDNLSRWIEYSPRSRRD